MERKTVDLGENRLADDIVKHGNSQNLAWGPKPSE